MKKIIILLIIFTAQHMYSQNAVKYWICFKDKSDSPYSKLFPAEFLSQRSIERREKMNIPIRDIDIPVNDAYVQQLKSMGITVIHASRWLNAVSAENISPDQIITIQQLPFVKNVTTVGKYVAPLNEIPEDQDIFYKTNEGYPEYYSGSYNQNHMIGVDFLHSLGFSGSGKVIAILDGGFYAVDVGPGFKSLRDKNQILGTRNFADTVSVYRLNSSHGSNVLSIIAADYPGKFVGSGPDANFYLLRTEVVDSERVMEEDNWLAAAEFADSLGVDIINSSLGYTTFDDSTEDHTYADMDGNTTIITNAADWAASVGILVCSSAGNEGGDEWHFISAPADGDSVFTIGAVDLNGYYASFSSQGPTFDGRIKPNVAGQGAGTGFVDSSGHVQYGSGTSYSSPLIAGACASFWSAFPELSNMDLIDIVQSTASQADDPDNLLGYGIPDFARAYLKLKDIELPQDVVVNILPNPVEGDMVTVYINGVEHAEAVLSMFDLAGRKILEEPVSEDAGKLTALNIFGFSQLASGIYIFQLTGESYTNATRIFVK